MNILLKQKILEIIIGGVLVFFSALPVQAKTFEINLFYDQSLGELRFDKFASEPVTINEQQELSQAVFLEESAGASGDYVAVMYDRNDTEIGRAGFDSQNGEFILQLPFFPATSTVQIIDGETKEEVVSVDVSKYQNCNWNGICEIENKENILDCMADCGVTNTQYSQATLEVLKASGGEIKNPNSEGYLLYDQAALERSNQPELPANQASQALEGTEQVSKDATFLLAVLFVALVIILSGGIYFARKAFRR